MAERRMFARSIIGGARFLRMPATSRLLYYDLGMAADDDGCVEAFSVMRMTGATEDDLRVLVSKGFVRLLNEDMVSYICDWRVNNQIRRDRYHEGRYKGLIGNECAVGLLPDNQMATKRQPIDNQMGDNLATEVRLGEVRLGEVSIGKSEADKPSTRQRFSPPSVEDVATYCHEKGYTIDPGRFVDYYVSVGWKVGKNPMRDWKAAVRTWARKDNPKPATPELKNCGYVLAPSEDPWESAMRRQQEAGQ